MSAIVRPCDRAQVTILAFQDELTALGLLSPGDGSARVGRRASIKPVVISPSTLVLRAQACASSPEDRRRLARLAAAEASAAEHREQLQQATRRPA